MEKSKLTLNKKAVSCGIRKTRAFEITHTNNIDDIEELARCFKEFINVNNKNLYENTQIESNYTYNVVTAYVKVEDIKEFNKLYNEFKKSYIQLIEKMKKDIELEKEIEEMKETENKKVWTEKEVLELLQKNPNMVLKSLIKIYEYQTAEEKANDTTLEPNGVGFNAFDAQILGSIARQLIRTNWISKSQYELVKKRIIKYKKQITKIINGGL